MKGKIKCIPEPSPLPRYGFYMSIKCENNHGFSYGNYGVSKLVSNKI